MKHKELVESIKILKALSDETRMSIYLLLLQGELCVCELVYILGYKQSRVSHSLRILRESELVISNREGKMIIYSVNPGLGDNKIIQGLHYELEISEEDLRKYKKCKREQVRHKRLIKKRRRST